MFLLLSHPMAQKNPSPLSHPIPLSMLKSKLSFFFISSHFILLNFLYQVIFTQKLFTYILIKLLILLFFNRGDPVAFRSYWEKVSDKSSVEIKGEEFMSYFGDGNNLCWYMLPQMREAILRIHNVVGNVVTKDKFIVLGNGSTQLFNALLYALSPSDPSDQPINVVAAAPYYSVIFQLFQLYNSLNFSEISSEKKKDCFKL